MSVVSLIDMIFAEMSQIDMNSKTDPRLLHDLNKAVFIFNALRQQH